MKLDFAVTLRVMDSRPECVIEGSQVRSCRRCRRDVFVSPVTLAVVDAGLACVCTRCVSRRELERLQPRVLPGQSAELARHLAVRN